MIEISRWRLRTARRSPAFTLVEGLLAIVLAGLVVVGLMTYFGNTLQGFAQQEDTLTGSRDAQILLSHLRADLVAVDGLDVSNTSSTGTTFPKSVLHVAQPLGGEVLQMFIHTRRREMDIRPGDDPIRDPMLPAVRTASWVRLLGIESDDPIAGNLPPGTATNDLLRRLNYGMNAAAWIRDRDEETDRWLALNVRDGTRVTPVSYRYLPKQRSLERRGPDGLTRLADGMLDRFAVSPCFEFITFPNQPGATAEFVKMWLEVDFALQAKADGGKIAKRTLPFATRVTPRYLNAVLKSRWTP